MKYDEIDLELDEMSVESDEESRHNTVIPCFVRDILVTYTNRYHPMTQQDILRILEKYPYSIVLERRALSRILDDLSLVYSYIYRNASGYYYSKSGDVL